jgi:hypothetical protein
MRLFTSEDPDIVDALYDRLVKLVAGKEVTILIDQIGGVFWEINCWASGDNKAYLEGLCMGYVACFEDEMEL